MKVTTEAVSLAVRRVMVACAPLLEGDHPKLRMFHWPLGKVVGLIPGISLILQVHGAAGFGVATDAIGVEEMAFARIGNYIENLFGAVWRGW